MSQPTSNGSASATKTAEKKALLCATFTTQGVGQFIDPANLTQLLSAAGITYTPQSMPAMMAKNIIVEDIKLFVKNHFATQNIDIETDVETAGKINTWFESALLRTNPMQAMYSGLIPQERIQELMASGALFGGFGGMQMNPMAAMMGGMGGAQMNPMAAMMGGMGGFGMGMGGGMPLWNAKKDDKQQATQQQQMNPMAAMMNPMMGMFGGMGGQQQMNPMAAMMNPMMGMMNPMAMMFGGMGGQKSGI